MPVVDAAKAVDSEHRLDGGPSSALAERLAQLSPRHPSSPGYPRDSPRAGQPADGKGEGAEAADRVRQAADAARRPELEARLADARAAGLGTEIRHTVDAGHEVWSEEREILHNEVIDALYSDASTVPCEYRAILAGGLPGAGKTTVLNEHAGIDGSRYLMINPDIIKDVLADRGMVPAVEGLSPMEATELVHEETSHLAKRLALRAQSDGRNLIWDVTMSTGASAEGRVEQLRAAGYTRVEAVFVDIPVDLSIRRAEERHRGDQEAFLADSGNGGRYVSPDVIVAQSHRDWGSQNRLHFERLKDRLDAWSVYDNSVDGRDPVLVQSYRVARDDMKETT